MRLLTIIVIRSRQSAEGLQTGRYTLYRDEELLGVLKD